MIFKNFVFLLFTLLSFQAVAQSKACDSAIKSRYEGNFQDKYGNTSSRKIYIAQFHTTFKPGSHKYGNNNALLYTVVVDVHRNGRIADRNMLEIYCITNSAGKVLGLERNFR